MISKRSVAELERTSNHPFVQNLKETFDKKWAEEHV